MWLWKLLGFGKEKRRAEPPAAQLPATGAHDPELERILAEHERRAKEKLKQMRLEMEAAEQERLDHRRRLESAGQILEGTWVVVAAEVDGKPRQDLRGERLIFEGEWAHFGPKYPRSKGGFEQDLTVAPHRIRFERHNPQFVPNYFTVAFAQVHEPRVASTVFVITTLHLAIYELEGDTLRLCGMGRDGQPPQEFATRPDTGQYLFVFRRERV
jgi:uncharacterized protein (TIGR03067 family)